MKLNKKVSVVGMLLAIVAICDIITLSPRVKRYRHEMATLSGGEYVFLNGFRWRVVGGGGIRQWDKSYSTYRMSLFGELGNCPYKSEMDYIWNTR